MTRSGMLVLAAALLLPGSVGAQKGPRCPVARTGAVVVCGAGVPTTAFTAADLATLPRQEATTRRKDGREVTLVGVPLGVLLGKATGNDKDRLKGTTLLQYLVAEARDGYRVVVALPEADSSRAAARRAAVMVAFQADGAPLDSVAGPIQLVAPLDLEHGRWVRQLECIRVARDAGS